MTAPNLRANPQRGPARLPHRHNPALRPPARLPPGLPVKALAGTSWPRRRRSAAIPTGSWPPPARLCPLDWAAATALLHPQRQPRLPQPRPGQAPGHDLDHLVRWVAAQPEGNRNAGLFWAANRALEIDPAADLSPLAAAARQAEPARRRDHPHTQLCPPHQPAPSPPARPPSRGN